MLMLGAVSEGGNVMPFLGFLILKKTLLILNNSFSLVKVVLLNINGLIPLPNEHFIAYKAV